MSRLLGFFRFLPLFSQYLCNKRKICNDQKSTFLSERVGISLLQLSAASRYMPQIDMNQPGTNWPDLACRSFRAETCPQYSRKPVLYYYWGKRGHKLPPQCYEAAEFDMKHAQNQVFLVITSISQTCAQQNVLWRANNLTT